MKILKYTIIVRKNLHKYLSNVAVNFNHIVMMMPPDIVQKYIDLYVKMANIYS